MDVDRETWRGWAIIFAREIAALDREVVVLTRSHASVKAWRRLLADSELAS